jgi:CO/xanthine dehydrogenase FAD-binding subunit
VINQYYRPSSIDEALKLLSITDEKVVPLGGGTQISHSHEPISVVDLQNLELNKIKFEGNSIFLGSTTTLHAVAENSKLHQSLRDAASKELNFNLRQIATLAGMVVTGDGRSILLTALLGMDAIITWLPGSKTQGLGEFLLTRNHNWPGRLIESLKIPSNVLLKFASVGRSPADLPVICVAVAKWPSGRVRIALGGFGGVPVLALDATESGGIDFAVKDALANSTDQWASAEYRQSVAAILVKRLLPNQ